MREIRLTDPDGYTVTTVRNVSETDVDTIRTRLLAQDAVRHAAFFDFAGYKPHNYTVTVGMGISPRTNEYENHVQHFWTREIDGTRYHFVHVKTSRLGHPYISVTRGNVLIRCSCRRSDCPMNGS